MPSLEDGMRIGRLVSRTSVATCPPTTPRSSDLADRWEVRGSTPTDARPTPIAAPKRPDPPSGGGSRTRPKAEDHSSPFVLSGRPLARVGPLPEPAGRSERVSPDPRCAPNRFDLRSRLRACIARPASTEASKQFDHHDAARANVRPGRRQVLVGQHQLHALRRFVGSPVSRRPASPGMWDPRPTGSPRRSRLDRRHHRHLGDDLGRRILTTLVVGEGRGGDLAAWNTHHRDPLLRDRLARRDGDAQTGESSRPEIHHDQRQIPNRTPASANTSDRRKQLVPVASPTAPASCGRNRPGRPPHALSLGEFDGEHEPAVDAPAQPTSSSEAMGRAEKSAD